MEVLVQAQSISATGGLIFPALEPPQAVLTILQHPPELRGVLRKESNAFACSDWQRPDDQRRHQPLFKLGSRRKVERVLYATENPSVPFIEFTIEYDAKEIAGDGRTDGVLTLRGDGVYDTKSRSFRELRNFGEQLRFQLADGGERQIQNRVIFAGHDDRAQRGRAYYSVQT